MRRKWGWQESIKKTTRVWSMIWKQCEWIGSNKTSISISAPKRRWRVSGGVSGIKSNTICTNLSWDRSKTSCQLFYSSFRLFLSHTQTGARMRTHNVDVSICLFKSECECKHALACGWVVISKLRETQAKKSLRK